MNTLNRLEMSALVMVWLAAAGAALAAAPPLDIPAGNAQSGLQDPDRKQVDAYVDYCIKALVAADTPEQVLEARKLITEGYNRFGTKAAEYQFYYAKVMSDQGRKILAGKLGGAEGMANLKLVNLAISVGRMATAALQPLADAMVTHKDAVVRYYGWSTYAVLRAPLLASGDKTAKAMYDALTRGCAQEADPQVIAEMVGMFRMPNEPDPDSGVSQAAWRGGQERILAILRGYWKDLCLKLMQGPAGVTEAGDMGIQSATGLAGGLGTAVDKKVTLQLVLDMTHAAGKAFDRGLQLRAAALAAKEAPDSPETRDAARKFGVDSKELPRMAGTAEHAVSAGTLLLESCEALLNKLTDRGDPGDRYIRTPLGKREAADRGAAVQLGVLKWEDELVKAYGLKHPGDTLKPPATQPLATQPAATQPLATQPAATRPAGT